MKVYFPNLGAGNLKVCSLTPPWHAEKRGFITEGKFLPICRYCLGQAAKARRGETNTTADQQHILSIMH
jgi:hypothetical protein